MSEKDVAKKVVELIGGDSNIVSVAHCATRLSLNYSRHNRVSG